LAFLQYQFGDQLFSFVAGLVGFLGFRDGDGEAPH
jgi:hypothetical protein